VRIVSGPGGYLLDLDLHRVDVHRFGRLLERARGEPDEAARAGLLREALALWRGPPLAGLAGRWIAGLRENLVQRRLSAVLALAPLELRLGRAEPLVDELRGLLVEHPLVEPLHAHLMRALQACGRGAEALEWYGRLRQLLADELGTDLAPELRELHQRILRGQPARAPSARGRVAVPAEPAPPAGLPSTVQLMRRVFRPPFRGRRYGMCRPVIRTSPDVPRCWLRCAGGWAPINRCWSCRRCMAWVGWARPSWRSSTRTGSPPTTSWCGGSTPSSRCSSPTSSPGSPPA
jgi:hypothetical protein